MAKSTIKNKVQQLALSLQEVDGGCVFCWAFCLRELLKAFPEYEAEIDKIWVSNNQSSGEWKRE
jgi:hypothetical protein